MILLIQANGEIPSQPEMDKVAQVFGVDMWHLITLGTGSKGDSDFVDIHQERFAERVHSAVLKIVDEMRDEVAQELMRAS